MTRFEELKALLVVQTPTMAESYFLESFIGGLVGKYSSFKIYKPQVQGTSLSTWDVVRREL